MKKRKGKQLLLKNTDKLTLVFIAILIIYLLIILPIRLCALSFSWHWFVFGLIAIIIPFAFIYFQLWSQKKLSFTKTQKEKANIVTFKNILYFWFLDCLYMTIFNEWTLWIYLLGIITLIKIFYGLVKAFLGKNQENAFIDISIIFEFLLGIGLSIYLIYLIPDRFNNLQSIVTTVIAAVYGGLLTLVGVAWTIKKGDKDRKEDERKKYFPYIKLVDKDNFDSTVIAGVYGTVDLDDEKNSKERDVYYRYDICKFSIKNIADSIIVLDGIELNGKFLAFTESKVLEKNDCCQIGTTGVFCCESWEPFNDISLIVKDILGNKYRVKCNTEKRSRWGKTDTPNKDGKLFDYEQSGIKIKTISLPELMQEEK